MAGGCTTQEVVVAHSVPLVTPQAPYPEAGLLDVGVIVFDSGVPDGEISEEVMEGTALFVMWLITDHTVTYRNENLFLANPLTLLALPLGLMLTWGSRLARSWLRVIWLVLAVSGALGLVLKIIPLFNQDNWRLIALILPVSLGFAGAFHLDRLLARASAPGRAPSGQPLSSSLKTP
jgi:hypothetical protein